MRKICSFVAIFAGFCFVAAPFALHLFDRTSAAEDLTDRIRPAMTANSLQALRTEFNTGRDAGNGFHDKVMPVLAARLGQTPEQFNALVLAKYPAVAKGMDEFPTVATTINGAISLFESDQARFHDADAIPTSSLPYTVGPWAMIALGVL